MSNTVTKPERSITSRTIFCDHCVAETSDKTPGNVSTINGIGRKFYGGAEPCPACTSVIRTLWWCFIEIPIVPLGSYRYKTSKEGVMRALYWSRKLPTRYWKQIWPTWLIGMLAALAIAIGFFFYEKYKRG